LSIQHQNSIIFITRGMHLRQEEICVNILVESEI
jgi:hypothetical protein